MNLKDFVYGILASLWTISPIHKLNIELALPSSSTSIVINLFEFKHWYKLFWFLETPLLDVEGFPFCLINKTDVIKPFLLKASSTAFACLVPSMWFFKFPSKFFFGGHSWNKSLQKVHLTLYQNDFNYNDYGSPTKTKGCSFAANGALTYSIILMLSITAFLWSSFVRIMVFPLRTIDWRWAKKITFCLWH